MADGLLDFLKTPEGQGLLSGVFGYAANARSGTPWNNIGRGGVAGLMGYGNALERQDTLAQRAVQQKLYDAQIANYNSEVEKRKADIAKQEQLQSMTQRLFGGTEGIGGTGLVPTVQNGPTFGNASGLGGEGLKPSVGAPSPYRNSGLRDADFNAVAALHAAGGPDLLPAWKMAQEGIEQKAGTYYIDPTTKERRYIVDPTKGFGIDAQGNSTLLPKFAENQAAIAGAQSEATEGAKAGYDFVTVDVKQPDGSVKPQLMRKDQASKFLGGQLGQTQQPTLTNKGTGFLTPEIQSIIAADDAKNGNGKPVTVNLNGAKAGQGYGWNATSAPQVPALQTPQYGLGLSQQEKDALEVAKARDKSMAEASAKAGAEKMYSSHEAAQKAADNLASIEEQRRAIASGVYGGAGADLKLALQKGFQGLGINIADPSKATNTDYLKSQLGQGVLAQAKTLGANPTDADARRIEDIVGTINKDPQALNKLIDYKEMMIRREIEQHNTRYKQAVGNGFQAPYDMEVKLPEKSGSNPAPAQTFPMLPPAAQYAGKRMQSGDGTIYRSNGKKWIKE